MPGRGLDFVDPWGNHVQVVEYADIQFTREAGVLAGMGWPTCVAHQLALPRRALRGVALLHYGTRLVEVLAGRLTVRTARLDVHQTVVDTLTSSTGSARGTVLPCILYGSPPRRSDRAD